MESADFDESEDESVSGETKRILVFNKKLSLCRDHVHDVSDT